MFSSNFYDSFHTDMELYLYTYHTCEMCQNSLKIFKHHEAIKMVFLDSYGFYANNSSIGVGPYPAVAYLWAVCVIMIQ